VGWSVGYKPPPESDLIDEILLAAGKALYLANRFESNCRHVLGIANLVDLIKDPVTSLEEVAAKLPKEKMLGPTLQGLLSHADMSIRPDEAAALTKAKEARNYIAHKGAAAIGELSSYSVQRKLDALRALRANVIDLANGDNIVSAWVYEIDEREPAPAIVDYYTDLVDDWIFGHLPREWLDPDWRPGHRAPETLIEAIAAAKSYKPWYSRPSKRRKP
jgi:hypothetical protein